MSPAATHRLEVGLIKLWSLVAAGASVVALLAVPTSGHRAGIRVAETPVPPVSQRLPAPPAGLDSSGRSLPRTAYAVPKGAVFMATSGSDDDPGSKAKPVQTLNRAVDLVPDGGTIVLRSGEYRDWYSRDDGTRVGVIRKDVHLQAYPGESPWISGADVVDDDRWTAVPGANTWQLSWETPELCDGNYYSRALTDQLVDPNEGPCSYADMSDNPSNPMANDPQMVFVDGRQLQQVPAGAGLDEKKFSYDWEQRRLTVGVDPGKHKVEVSRRPTAMVLAGEGRSSVRGIGFHRFASSQYPGPTGSAVISAAPALTVENAVFSQNAAQGLSISRPWDGAVVRHSVFADNGYNGLGANGGSRNDRSSPLLVEQNVFRRNNLERFGERCTISCGAAAAKFAHIHGLTVTGNLVADTRGPAVGLWCDLDCSDATFTFNVVRGHQKSGIFYEVSDRGLIAGNLLVDNEYGVNVASARTKVYQNTLVDNVQGINVYDDVRTRGKDGWDDIGPDTHDVSVVDNVVTGRSYSLKAGGTRADGEPGTDIASLFGRVEGNVFHQPVYQPKFVYLRYSSGRAVECRPGDQRPTCADLQRNLYLPDLSDPLFVDRRAGDYRIRVDSVAYRRAESLPGDVAAALGVSRDDSTRSPGALARP